MSDLAPLAGLTPAEARELEYFKLALIARLTGATNA